MEEKKTTKPDNEQNGGSHQIEEEKQQPLFSGYCELSDVMIQMGKSIRDAQEQMDQKAVEIQLEIQKNPGYQEFPMEVRCFAIKETEIELKVNLQSFRDEEGFHLLIAPFNAEYLNRYSDPLSDSEKEQS